MLDEICRHLNNYFTAWRGIYPGTYRVEDGTIELPFLAEGQYFRIVGSCLNDGVYRYPAEGLSDEVFYGEIWAMKVPKGLLSLMRDIEAWMETYGEKAQGPYQSESFAGYTYRLRDNADGSTWQDVFRRRLNPFRRLG